MLHQLPPNSRGKLEFYIEYPDLEAWTYASEEYVSDLATESTGNATFDDYYQRNLALYPPISSPLKKLLAQETPQQKIDREARARAADERELQRVREMRRQAEEERRERVERERRAEEAWLERVRAMGREERLRWEEERDVEFNKRKADFMIRWFSRREEKGAYD